MKLGVYINAQHPEDGGFPDAGLPTVEEEQEETVERLGCQTAEVGLPPRGTGSHPLPRRLRAFILQHLAPEAAEDSQVV